MQGLTADKLVRNKSLREKEAFFIVFKNMKSLFFRSLGRKKLAIAFAGFIVAVGLAAGILIYEETKKTVSLTLNGKQTVIRTHADTIHELMGEQRVLIHSKDYLFPRAETPVTDGLKVVWRQAKQVEIVRDDEKKTVWTTAGTVSGFLKEQNITYNGHDQITPKPERALKNRMKVHVKKAVSLTLIDGRNKTKVWSTSTTVADLLNQQGIKLDQLDRVEPSLAKNIKENDIVKVIRVEKVTDVVNEPIPFAVKRKKDIHLKDGVKKTLRKGIKGMYAKHFVVILENGKEVSRKLIRKQKVREKRDKIIAVGSSDVSRTGSGKEFIVKATAYTASCGGCSGNTATGLNLHANPNAKVIAVDPRVIPLGSKVYVDGYGYAVAADTGGAIKGYKIDVFLSSTAEAFRWGQRRVKVKILH